MEAEDSLPYSQKPATSPYPELETLSLNNVAVFFFNKIQVVHEIISRKPKYQLLLSDSNRNWNVYGQFSIIPNM
jgi:hypothetical protein